jgi:hypothetical protein
MKKDKEWLKEKIQTMIDEEYRCYDPLIQHGKHICRVIMDLIEQLDEPEIEQSDKKTRELESYNDELIRDNNQLRNALDNQEVLSQEWIDENKVARIDNLRKMTTGDVVPVEKLKNLIVPKQDKPVIPQFVVDYYNDYKYYELTFEEWFECEEFGKGGKTENKMFEWLLDNSHEVNIERQFIFADIIAHGLDGYEVEREKKYQVIIRDGEYVRLYLCKNNGNVMIGTNDNYIEKCPEVTYLTEQEIKAIDERYWAFAEEVKPCN